MHFQLDHDLPKLLQEVGHYVDDKLKVDTWGDPAGGLWFGVTLKTEPPTQVLKIRSDTQRWRVDVYRQGKWERWLHGMLLELRQSRERERLAKQVRAEQEEAAKFAPVDDSDLFG